MTTGSTIDLHAHVVLPAAIGAAGSAGPEIGYTDGKPWFRVGGYVLHGVRYEGSAFMDVSRRIELMDEHAIDIQLLSPNPLTYFTDLDVPSAVAYARAHNDDLATIVQAHPDRLLGAAQLPMQDVDASIAEIDRAVRDLGLRAAYIDTDPARTLDAPEMDAFYEAIIALEIPLFVHPTSIGPGGPPADPRLQRWDLDLLLGFAYGETLAVAALIFGGVLDRHPKLDVCVSHGGGAIQTLAGRFARAAQVRAWTPESVREAGFDAYLRRIWFDTHLHNDVALAGLIDRTGTDRLVFGTNFAGWDADAPGERPDARGADLAANARRLLRL